jgi:hypothetical protein
MFFLLVGYIAFLAFAARGAEAADVGLGRVTAGFEIAAGPQRDAARISGYNDAIASFDAGDGYLEFFTTLVETITINSEVFFQANDNQAVLGAIESVRCGSDPAVVCTVSSASGNWSANLSGVNIVMAINGSAAGSTHGLPPGDAGFDAAVLSAINSAAGPVNASVDALSVSGEVSYRVDLWKNESLVPTNAADVARVDTLRDYMDTAMAALVTAQGGPGDSAVAATRDYCAVRTCDTCSASTGICDCPADTWGVDCEVPCVCQNGGTCGPTACRCDYPYMGRRCDAVKTCVECS